MTEQFIPAWADGALTKPPPVDAAELKLLREFYTAWVHYHTLPKDGRQKDRQRNAGAKLIAIHEELQMRLENAHAG